ncbi:MAG: TonB family protein [Blastocatellia bacterium]|nr:TonB family protein [Blastocatellia bacterium]
MSKQSQLLHGFIYSTPGVKEFEAGTETYWSRRGWDTALAVSFGLHLAIGGWVVYRRYVAPLEAFTVIEKNTQIQWVALDDPRFKPLKNPGNLFAVPKKVLPLEDLKKLMEETEKKRQAEREKARKIKEKQKDGADQKDEQVADKPETRTEPAPAAGPPKFGVINSAPIKQIVGQMYEKYKAGDLKVENAEFSITLMFHVLKDGSVEDIKIVKSSNSKEIDEAAFNVARAIGESRALAPLSSLTSMSIMLENTVSFSRLRITGFAPAEDEAARLASTFNAVIVIAQMAQKERQPDVAELLRNLEIKADGKRLSGNISLTRSQANSLMRKGFGQKTS